MKVRGQQTSEHQGQESANQPARKERGDFEYIEFIALKTREEEKKKRGNGCHISHSGFTAHVLTTGKGLFGLLENGVTDSWCN